MLKFGSSRCGGGGSSSGGSSGGSSAGPSAGSTSAGPPWPPRGGVFVLNVGGRRYGVSREALRALPLARLARLERCGSARHAATLCDDYDHDRNEFFFDRHADAFRSIMTYVKYGKLRFLPHMCELSFYSEMAYWGLERHHLEACCQRRLDDRRSDSFTHYEEEEEGGEGEGEQGGEEEEEEIRAGGAQRRTTWLDGVRRTFEEPTSSLAAQILASVSVAFVVVSTALLCTSTLPGHTEHRAVEAVCIGWFTAECAVRFAVSRDRCGFLRRPLNAIDLLAITPYYVSLAVGGGAAGAGVALRVLRATRIFWVIKLARHFLGLQTLGLTLRRCYREMVMLLVFICVAMAIFGALAQLLEHGLQEAGSRNQDYASIPAACWWVIISMTTVGYGDVCPVTTGGRVLGGLCVVSGIVLLALPITFIYHSFLQCYHETKYRSAAALQRSSARSLSN